MNKVQLATKSGRRRLMRFRGKTRLARAAHFTTQKAGLVVGTKYLFLRARIGGVPVMPFVGAAAGIVNIFVDSPLLSAPLGFAEGVGDADTVGLVQLGKMMP